MTGLDCVIGVDGGGTKTVAIVADRQGNALGRGAGGPCSLSSMTPLGAFESVRDACRGALRDAGRSPADVAAVCAGVAGWSVERHRTEFTELLADHFGQVPLSVLPDYAIALAGASAGGPGVVVIAGTGSIAYGENAAGELMRAGGYGYLIDDAGSAYGVGRAAIAAVLKAADGLAPSTTLSALLPAACGMESVADIAAAVYDGRLGRPSIAALAGPAADAAAGGDRVAGEIFEQAAQALAALAAPIAARLFPRDPAPLIPIGGLWQAGPCLTVPFAKALTAAAPSLRIAASSHAPEQGAVLKALGLRSA